MEEMGKTHCQNDVAILQKLAKTKKQAGRRKRVRPQIR